MTILLCLAEDGLDGLPKTDIAALAGKLLLGQEINLSDQTLLPRDLNTIGFFLCRSITKQWETLNLLMCNIGVTGCDILCNRFLDEESRDTITIKKADIFMLSKTSVICLSGHCLAQKLYASTC